MNTEVESYLKKSEIWNPELKALRDIILNCGLTEDFKWRNPCYTYKGKNIVMIGSFKAYCNLSFFKGVLLKDSKNILKSHGPNSRSVRMVPFTDISDIIRLEPVLKNYIHEAVEVEKSGLQIHLHKEDKTEFPEELKTIFRENPDFHSAFSQLTSGRQRGYLLYFSAARQSATRTARIEKYKDRILRGKGIHDCVCGLSKKMPNCDGSHKYLKGS